jgi:hypothetical protein
MKLYINGDDVIVWALPNSVKVDNSFGYKIVIVPDDVKIDKVNNEGIVVPMLASEVIKELENLPYYSKRSAEYPPITDYIDGVVKGDQAQIQAYIDACLAIKAKYPKGA